MIMTTSFFARSAASRPKTPTLAALAPALFALALMVTLAMSTAMPSAAHADANTTDSATDPALATGQTTADTNPTTTPSSHLSVRAKPQGKGWKAAVAEGKTAGTINKKGLCGIKIALDKTTDISGSINYQAYVEGSKWLKPMANGKAAGLAKKPMSALRIWLTGDAANRFDVYYRVYVKDFGWLGWARNKQIAGTTKAAEELCAVQVRLVAKGELFDGDNTGYRLKSRWPTIEAKYLADDDVDQLLEVKYLGGTKAKVVLRKKSGAKWKTALSCTGYVGKLGIGKAREGDSRTPSGDYEITSAFGIKDDPGSKLPYVKVNSNMYWCGDRAYYNQLVDVSEHPHNCSGEHLIDYSPHYNYGLFYDYNTNPVKYGAGSALFVHCSGGSHSTAGCIAVSQKNMIKIIRMLTPGARVCTYAK